jgi:hypothetical protein
MAAAHVGMGDLRELANTAVMSSCVACDTRPSTPHQPRRVDCRGSQPSRSAPCRSGPRPRRTSRPASRPCGRQRTGLVTIRIGSKTGGPSAHLEGLSQSAYGACAGRASREGRPRSEPDALEPDLGPLLGLANVTRDHLRGLVPGVLFNAIAGRVDRGG